MIYFHSLYLNATSKSLFSIRIFITIIIIEIEFEKMNNTKCLYGEDTFESLEDAIVECKTSKQCKGIFDNDCIGNQSYYLCSGTPETDITIDSCTYKKVIIGNFTKTLYEFKVVCLVIRMQMHIVFCFT